MTPDPWRFQKWAFETPVGNPVRKAVLSMLAMMADMNTGRCEAKQDTLALGVEVTERAVRGHLKALEGMGLIARRPQFRFDRGRRGDEYLLLAPGVKEWPDGERIAEPTPRNEVPGEDGSGGTDRPHPPEAGGTPPGVSVVPGKNNHQGTTTKNNHSPMEARASTSAPDAVHRLPDDLPEGLHETTLAAGRVLYRAAKARGQKRAVMLEAVGRAVGQQPTKDHVAVAEKIEHWLCWGNGQKSPCKDIVGRFRDWLPDSADVRLPDGSPLADPAPRAANVHPIRQSNGKPSHDQLLAELRAANPRLQGQSVEPRALGDGR